METRKEGYKTMKTSRPEITASLSAALEKYIDPHHDPRIYWAKEVTFDYSTASAVRVDYMRFVPLNNTVSGIEKGDFYCYEIKSSVADFHSKNGHNFIGDFNYYVMPEDVAVAMKDLIPWGIGIMVPEKYVGLRVLKKARRQNRQKPVCEMLLMMWRSSRREIVKPQKENAITNNVWQEAQPLYPDIKAYDYGEMFAQFADEEEAFAPTKQITER